MKLARFAFLVLCSLLLLGWEALPIADDGQAEESLATVLIHPVHGGGGSGDQGDGTRLAILIQSRTGQEHGCGGSGDRGGGTCEIAAVVETDEPEGEDHGGGGLGDPGSGTGPELVLALNEHDPFHGGGGSGDNGGGTFPGLLPA